MDIPDTYTLDCETIKLNAYRLLCLFYANKEIARLSDPESPNDSASALEQRFFRHEITQLLLSIAIAVRVLDDQMYALPKEDAQRQAYFQSRDQVDREHSCMIFGDLCLREVCNKIIHATTVDPQTRRGTDSHKIDEYNRLGWSEASTHTSDDIGPEPAPIDWDHLSSNVRLGGVRDKKKWVYLLQVPTLVEAIYDLLRNEQ